MAGAGRMPNGAARDPVAMIEAVRPSSELDGVTRSLERMCRAAAENLDLMSAAVRLLPQNGSAGVIVAAEGVHRQLADIEYDVGEGPGTTSYATSRPVLVADLAGSVGDEWPGFRTAATERGVAAVFAFPLHLGAVEFGTFELFADRSGPLTSVQVGLARAFAEIGVEMLLDGDAARPEGSLPPDITRRLGNRAEVAQAQGMVMVDLDTNLGNAMARLRGHAFARGLTLSELALRVIGGYELSSDDEPVADVES